MKDSVNARLAAIREAAIPGVPTPVVVYDHGKQFGHDHWYTFACPSCGAQVARANNEDATAICRERTTLFGAKGCDTIIEWPKRKEVRP